MAADQRLKYKPPNRDKDRVEALWSRLKSGHIQLLGSDHAPLPKDTSLDIWEINGGVGNMLEVMLSLSVTEAVEHRGFSLHQMVKILCENPARIYGLFPRKGCIQPGSDADMVILNEENGCRIDSDRLSMIIQPYSVFEGRAVSMQPDTVVVRGQMIVENREIVSETPRGRFVPAQYPSPFPF
jgi:dihydroorotase-like cyclic amidohydrolase